MPPTSWHDFYYSAWQEPWALLVAPFAFAVWRGIAPPPGPGALPELGGFVVRWSALFTVLTMLDPIATGPLAKAIGTEAAGTGLGLGFVLLGDFRIWWLVFALAGAPSAARLALLPTAGIPAAAYLVTRSLGPWPGQALWLTHEALFVMAAFAASRRVASPLARSVLAYAAVYYALWASADVLILAGVDAGWLIRCLPNQLYYGFTVPFVWWLFFASSYAVTSSSAQASR